MNRNISVVLFDWGNTIMRDAGFQAGAMCDWPKVEALPGAMETLQLLNKNYVIGLATGAEDSGVREIQLALSRVSLLPYFHHIFCLDSLGVRKNTPQFYKRIVQELKTKPDQCVMVGDSFQADVLMAGMAGLFGIWFNPQTTENRTSESHLTIHHLEELPSTLAAIQGRP